jgi:formate-dependent nitrite reductase membrane component NrfD
MMLLEIEPAGADPWTIASYLANAAVLALIAFGLYHRHRRRIHVPVMLTCLVVDVVNVIRIELGRKAVEKALETATTSGEWLLKFHILVSTLCVVGYLVAAFTGWKLLHGLERYRRVHRGNMVFFLFTRVLNFLTSFYV